MADSLWSEDPATAADATALALCRRLPSENDADVRAAIVSNALVSKCPKCLRLLREWLDQEPEAKVRVAIFQALGGPLAGGDARRYFDDLRTLRTRERADRVRAARLAAVHQGREEFTEEQFERHFRWLVTDTAARSSTFESIEDEYYRSAHPTVRGFAEWYCTVRGSWD